ncbi:uncharacterized protein LOC103475901 [Poecilia reticulata]|uniref:uncharacterized protein LOC103475901 n=1 Tax=Poecilia reticulata TaxID=8081 RepID=UPI0004A3EB74|nr:PREDICTED: uncharacterized protein LOC103475901 [Poecilia reticulata]
MKGKKTNIQVIQRKPTTLTSDANFIQPIALNKPKARLTASDTIIPAGGSVTLTCSVDIDEGWKIYWFRQKSVSSTARSIRSNKPDGFLSVSNEGVYSCRGGREDPVFYTEYSSKVTINETVAVSRPFNSLFPVMLIVGPVVGIVLIILMILLILLWRCRRSKDLSNIRLNQAETQNDGSVYSSLLHGDSSLYETIQLSRTSGNVSAERIHHPAEDPDYDNVDQGK